jgi:ankyrin repeat protein
VTNNKKKRTPDLYHAAANDDVEELRAAIALGQRLDEAPGFNSWTPLHTAAFYGSESFIREALKYGHANVWHYDVYGKIPWDYAVARGDERITKRFFNAMYPGSPILFSDLDPDF